MAKKRRESLLVFNGLWVVGCGKNKNNSVFNLKFSYFYE